ncbi:MAG: hypothetical protein ABW133_19460 [Polyangiaceae bacterium]
MTRAAEGVGMSRRVAVALGVAVLFLVSMRAARAASPEPLGALTGAASLGAASSGAASSGTASTASTASTDSRFAFLDSLPPRPAELPPEPSREPDEYPRRAWEVFPSGGVGTPFCRGTAFGLGRCGDANAGATLGLGALYRVTPHVAFGLDASFAHFGSGATNVAAYDSLSTWVGLLVRGYFFDHGALDPYVETGFGQATSITTYRDGDVDVRTESAAPSVETGAGIDFWVAPFLRFGPAVSYRFAWISRVNGCASGICTSYGVDERGSVGSYATFSVRATVGFGREM